MIGIETGVVAKAATSAVVTKLFSSAYDRVGRVAKGPSKSIALKAIASLQGYASYLEETNERVATFKTFANPTQPVSVMDHFVTIEFDNGKNNAKINQDDVVDRLIRPSRIVISATAGYGKSMAMRYFALSLFENPRGRIPLFMELRHLNRVTTPDILTYIHTNYRKISDVQIESFRQGLRAGVFVILLDGFDELNHDLRHVIEAQILEMSMEYPQCSIVVSGRPDDRFSAWRSFSTLKICPMTKARVVELINNLDYDHGVKKRFLRTVGNGLYEKHESFLSTPLLAILMLLTYEQNANIPDKMHLFYAKAFETLFHKHDAMKEQYDRSRRSNLQIDEFQKVFSIFCLNTYVLEKNEFTKTELSEFIRQALNYEKHDVNVDDYFFDIVEAVCLLMREGTSYFFVHRSFQEYFSALFLANCQEDIRDDFIDHVSDRHWDNVLPMLFDMASAQIEPTWVIKNIDNYLDNVSIENVEKIHPFRARFGGFGFYKYSNNFEFAAPIPGEYSKFIAILSKFYPSYFKDNRKIDIGCIERYGKENWSKLNCEEEVVHNLDNDETVSIRNLKLDSIPHNLFEESGLYEMAANEYLKISEIRKGVDIDQKAKNEFLKKLFST